MRATIIGVIIVAAVAALLWSLNNAFPDALGEPQNQVRLATSLGWLLLLAGSAVLRVRANPGSALRALGAWLLIGLVLVWVYAYRFEAQEIGNRMLSVLVPSHGVITVANNPANDPGASTGGEIRFALNQYGHYQINARVNGVAISFIVDTGASDVVLSPDDAKRIGFGEGMLTFSERAETANGVAYIAPVTLNNISVGPISLNGLPAKVNQTPMAYSLLGMRFLNKLHGWRVEGQTLVLEE